MLKSPKEVDHSQEVLPWDICSPPSGHIVGPHFTIQEPTQSVEIIAQDEGVGHFKKLHHFNSVKPLEENNCHMSLTP